MLSVEAQSCHSGLVCSGRGKLNVYTFDTVGMQNPVREPESHFRRRASFERVDLFQMANLHFQRRGIAGEPWARQPSLVQEIEVNVLEQMDSAKHGVDS